MLMTLIVIDSQTPTHVTSALSSHNNNNSSGSALTEKARDALAKCDIVLIVHANNEHTIMRYASL